MTLQRKLSWSGVEYLHDPDFLASDDQPDEEFT
jgi:hypothetical protein